MSNVSKRISVAMITVLVIAIALSVFLLPQKVYADPIPEVGDIYGGGIVAYILQSGDPGYEDGKVKGIIGAITDESFEEWAYWDIDSYEEWALGDYYDILVPGGTSTALWSGSDNTDKIIAQGGPEDYAACLSREYNGGGYSDWHLPSLDELIKLFSSGILSSPYDEFYWSSSEYDNDEAYTYGGDGPGIGYEYKDENWYFIPVRYFEIPLNTVISQSNPVEEVSVPTLLRNHDMTCWQVYINEDNNFEFIFWWLYGSNNWVRIYNMDDELVFEKDLEYGDPVLEVDLPDGFYTVRTYFTSEEPIQEFLIGKP